MSDAKPVTCLAPTAPSGARELMTKDLDALVTFLRADADFSRSWIDGRRGGPDGVSADDMARTLARAKQSDDWANAVQMLQRSFLAGLQDDRHV